jgi:hypothetical protein
MRRIDLTDPTGNPRHPRRISLLLTEGAEDDWGDFEPLRGTSWEVGVELIDADAISHALHGHFMPLIRALGREPYVSAKRVTAEEGECKSQDFCPTWNPEVCRPGGKGCPPDCYEPPLSEGTDLEIVNLFRIVTQAWKEGRRTVVSVGEGFNIL